MKVRIFYEGYNTEDEMIIEPITNEHQLKDTFHLYEIDKKDYQEWEEIVELEDLAYQKREKLQKKLEKLKSVGGL